MMDTDTRYDTNKEIRSVMTDKAGATKSNQKSDRDRKKKIKSDRLISFKTLRDFIFPSYLRKNIQQHERAMGVEPTLLPWQGSVIPLDHARDLYVLWYPKISFYTRSF